MEHIAEELQGHIARKMNRQEPGPYLPEQYADLEAYIVAREGEIRRKRSAAKQGEKSRTSVLTEAQVLAIRAQYVPGKRGTGSKAMAKQYGVHYRTIDMILNRETWKHI
ncbi:hypothetical protein [Paenibacillus sp. FSL R5-0908]|uniref:hypothetical protein n=1 Tax=Paenibacillus sp. FSL R5-0908 TaxID=2921664 RepID=UPI0030FB62E8